MANREDLLIIRAARTGDALAQLKLGKRYLFGGAGQPKNLPTALFWLDRAARQDQADAWMLIGEHVPFETAQRALQPVKLALWYERAFEAGVARAGLVLAKLVLQQPQGVVEESTRTKALRALQTAAQAGVAEAQWMLAQTAGQAGASVAAWPSNAPTGGDSEAMLEWATRVARSGLSDARHAMADHAWARGDLDSYLQWAMPIADSLLAAGGASNSTEEREIALVLRAAHALSARPGFDVPLVTRLLEWAAQTGNGEAQYALGLWTARMDSEGQRLRDVPGACNYKRAIRWLSLAAGNNVPAAWFALSKIYQRPDGAFRNPEEAECCMEKAARAGYAPAQFEFGMALWRKRREHFMNDVLAVKWLVQARAMRVPGAAEALDRIAPPVVPASWAMAMLHRARRAVADSEPLLVARIELAACFGLTRAEALLIDPAAADAGHCLVVDVCREHVRTRRRLVLIQTAKERATLDSAIAEFERAGGGEEGNFRQRLYRLKTLA